MSYTDFNSYQFDINLFIPTIGKTVPAEDKESIDTKFTPTTLENALAEDTTKSPTKFYSKKQQGKQYHFKVMITKTEFDKLNLQGDKSAHFSKQNQAKFQKVVQSIVSHATTVMKKSARDATIVIDNVTEGSIEYHFEGKKPKYKPEAKDARSIIYGNLYEIDQTRTVLQKLMAEPKPSPFQSFLTALCKPFQAIHALYKSLSGQSQRELQWDLALLADMADFPLDEVPMAHALDYMASMLKREAVAGEPNKELIRRIEKGARRAKQIEKVRESFSPKKCKSLVRLFRKEIHGLQQNEKMLMPVGYSSEGMLMEVTCEIDGTYTVALIGRSKAMHDYLDKEVQESEQELQSFRHVITGVQLNDLWIVIPALS